MDSFRDRLERRDYDSMLDDLRRYMGALEVLFARVAKRRNGDAAKAAAAVAGLSSALDELEAARDSVHDARREAEGEHARYKDLFAAAPDGYLVTDLRGVVTEANLAAAGMLGVPHAYLLNKPMFVFMAAGSKDAYWSTLRGARTDGRVTAVLWIGPRGRPAIAAQVTVTGVERRGVLHPGELRWILRDVTAEQAAAAEVASHRAQFRQLTAEVAAAEERERRRIAVGIHDRVSQPLAAARMMLGRLRATVGAGQGAGGTGANVRKSTVQLDELLKVLDVAIGECRTLTFELSPPVLYELGLGPALRWLADEIGTRYGIAVRVKDGGIILPVEPRVFLYQAARELLTNVGKHAGASVANVVVRREDGRVRMTVSDDGKGFATDAAERRTAAQHPQGGFGLFSLRTRVDQLAGSFEIRSSPKKGTHVTISVPAA